MKAPMDAGEKFCQTDKVKCDRFFYKPPDTKSFYAENPFRYGEKMPEDLKAAMVKLKKVSDKINSNSAENIDDDARIELANAVSNVIEIGGVDKIDKDADEASRKAGLIGRVEAP